MRAATTAIQRPPGARLLVVAADGSLLHTSRARLAEQLAPGDLLVANDAATLPASLAGVHERSGGAVEVRLAGRRSLAADEVHRFTAVVFGAGDYRTRTEDRPAPPRLRAGDRLRLGPLTATILATLDHPRLVVLAFEGGPDAIWAGIARHGRPIQYSHLPEPLALWDVWTRVASLPVAYEPPSAGFLLDWRLLEELKARGIGFATLTHAAGISSTGDPALDASLPFDEPYHLPEATVRALAATRARGGRVVALGTTVTRALEQAARREGGVAPGAGLATLRLGPGTRLEVVDAVVTGVHQPGDSHYRLLGAFAADEVLERMSAALERLAYRAHEFGDSVLVERESVAGRLAEPVAGTRSAAAGPIPGVGELAAVERQAAAADALGEPALESLELGEPLLDARRPPGGEPGPVATGRHAIGGQLGQLGADLVERQPDPLGEDDEGDAPQHLAPVAAVAGARSLRADEAPLLVVAQRRGREAAAPRDLSDGEQLLHDRDPSLDPPPPALAAPVTEDGDRTNPYSVSIPRHFERQLIGVTGCDPTTEPTRADAATA
jgi:S-adenosylmethionine:tRNA ribosyltransferase-isomerase